MTRNFSYALLASTLIAAPAFADSIPVEMDVDGNGSLSLEEMQVAFPTITPETFGLIDVNGDGEADESEVTAAVDAGYLVFSG
ncbi:EF-hand domain-containing protein [Epibacterium ulvae]|uniref:EF-hand domain-containing protein n=1 Tax=Epibacterium ulvae TaxID=1156985 RepID=UPI001BFC323F|nr:EF-hand domain-containing protein [Epibacterium ulvae]MBT8155424.1 EF-hand domain-containing protein [Epibacterium ulvae]